MRHCLIFMVFLLIYFNVYSARQQLTPDEIATYSADLKSADRKVRYDAIGKLARDNQDSILLEALKNADSEMKQSLLRTLVHNTIPTEVVDAFINIMLNDPDVKVRQTVVIIIPSWFTISKYKDFYPKIKIALLNVTNDVDSHIAETAMSALPDDDIAFIPNYLEMVKTNPHHRIRSIAINRLVKLKDPRAFEVLLGLINDPQVEVVKSAINGLGEIGNRRATSYLLNFLKNPQQHSDYFRVAGNALALLADPTVLDDLIALAQQRSLRQDVRLGAIYALSGYSDIKAGDSLIALLQDTDLYIREITTYAFMNNQYKPAVTPLIDAYNKEKDGSLKQQIFRTLAKFGDSKCFDIFIAMLESDNINMRYQAIIGLSNIKDMKSFDVLIKLYLKEPLAIRAFIAKSLKTFDNPRPLEMLIADFKSVLPQESVEKYRIDINSSISYLMGRGISSGSAMWVGPPESKPKDAIIPVGLRKLKLDEQWKLGSVGPVLLTMYNGTANAIVVSHVYSIQDSGANTIPLSGSVLYPITKLTEKGVYLSNESIGQQASEYSMYAGLLLPGQIVQVVVPNYHSIGMSDRYVVEYWQAKEPYDGTKESLAPFTILIPQFIKDEKGNIIERKFVPFDEKEWRIICAWNERIPITGPLSGLRSVLIESKLPELQQSINSVSAPCEKLTTSVNYILTTASRITNVESNKLKFTYSAALGSYIVGEPDGKCWKITNDIQKERGDVLPNVPFTIYSDVDYEYAIIQVSNIQPTIVKPGELTGIKHWNRYPLFAGDGKSMLGEFFKIKPTELYEFLITITDKKAIVKQKDIAFGGHYFILEEIK